MSIASAKDPPTLSSPTIERVEYTAECATLMWDVHFQLSPFLLEINWSTPFALHFLIFFIFVPGKRQLHPIEKSIRTLIPSVDALVEVDDEDELDKEDDEEELDKEEDEDELDTDGGQ